MKTKKRERRERKTEKTTTIARERKTRMAPSQRSEERGSHDSDHDTSVAHSSNAEPPIHDYIPDYLKRAIFPCAPDFCQTPLFHPRLVAHVMAEGFLPIATEGVLLPKLHRRRCAIVLPHDLRVSKSARKKSKRFLLSVNRDFDGVIRGCQEQHSPSCWLLPPLVNAFRELHDADFTDAVMVSKGGRKCPVRMYSIEVWNQEGVLVAGELGYSVGSIYTSLTGFCKEKNAGAVQLLALGRLLSQNGFTLWDLGMDMEYKRDLGSTLIPRSEYVQEVKRVRITNGHVVLPRGQEPVNCREIIDREVPVAQVPPREASAAKTGHPAHSSPVTEDHLPHKKAREKSPESVEKVPGERT